MPHSVIVGKLQCSGKNDGRNEAVAIHFCRTRNRLKMHEKRLSVEKLTYLLPVCTDPKINITERTTTNSLGDAVFLRCQLMSGNKENVSQCDEINFYGIFT